jgi:integrase
MNKYSHLDESTKLAIDSFLKTAMKLAKKFGQTNPSEDTQNEYIKLAKQLLSKKFKTRQSLRKIISSTRSKYTYYKRIAAIRYYILQIGSESAKTLMKEYCPIAENNLKKADADIQALFEVIQSGAGKMFSKTASKRSSLKGLPDDWMEQICNHNKNSKYRDAFHVATLTGCRPSELKKGVSITYKLNFDGKSELTFKIIGSKVTTQSGQEWRTITYHDIERMGYFSEFLESIKKAGTKKIYIDSPINFTQEIRRIAKHLWSDHKKPITAYCFRHQFSANLKKVKIGDDISKALGHRSTKTRRLYGVASQARGKPVEITISSSHDLKQHIAKGNDGVEP